MVTVAAVVDCSHMDCDRQLTASMCGSLEPFIFTPVDIIELFYMFLFLVPTLKIKLVGDVWVALELSRYLIVVSCNFYPGWKIRYANWLLIEFFLEFFFDHRSWLTLGCISLFIFGLSMFDFNFFHFVSSSKFFLSIFNFSVIIWREIFVVLIRWYDRLFRLYSSIFTFIDLYFLSMFVSIFWVCTTYKFSDVVLVILGVKNYLTIIAWFHVLEANILMLFQSPVTTRTGYWAKKKAPNRIHVNWIIITVGTQHYAQYRSKNVVTTSSSAT